MKVSVIIPTCKPDEKLAELVGELFLRGFCRVILVDDGSGDESRELLAKLSADGRCVVLHHTVPLGRGRALKTAFNYFLGHVGEDVGVVTADDGSYLPEDIRTCAEELERVPERIVLGARNFNDSDIPRRNAFGNRIAAWSLRNMCGIKVSDAQTGLRAIPKEFVQMLMNVSGERFDFETNMLLESGKKQVEITELPLTGYNAAGGYKYNPFADSLKILRMIVGFISSSLFCTVVDVAVFVLLKTIFSFMEPEFKLFISTAVARIISSGLNFIINRKIVFKSDVAFGKTVFRYIVMTALKMIMSYGGTYLLAVVIGLPETFSKLLIDLILGVMSYEVQRRWVFGEGAK